MEMMYHYQYPIIYQLPLSSSSINEYLAQDNEIELLFDDVINCKILNVFFYLMLQ